jgi:hypothetical protein
MAKWKAKSRRGKPSSSFFPIDSTYSCPLAILARLFLVLGAGTRTSENQQQREEQRNAHREARSSILHSQGSIA